MGKYVFVHEFLVCSSLSQCCILGTDFLKKFNGKIDYKENILKIGEVVIDLDTGKENFGGSKNGRVVVESNLIIPGRHEMIIKAKVKGVEDGTLGLLETKSCIGKKNDLVAARVIARVDKGYMPVQLINTGYDPVTIYGSTGLGLFEELKEIDSISRQVCSVENNKVLGNKASNLCPVSDADLSDREKCLLGDLLNEFDEIFSRGSDDLGQTSLVEHTIDTGTALPIKQKSRPMPLHRRQEGNEIVDRMLRSGLIVPSNSPWSSPVVLVRKKDGSARFCVDFRKR